MTTTWTPRATGRIDEITLGGVVLFLTALAGSGCPTPDVDGPAPPVDAPAAPGHGDGVVVRDGEETPYRVDADATRLLILVKKKDGLVCDPLHSHAVEAAAVTWTFRIDQDDAASSTIAAVLPAAGLVPDLPENRALFDETRDVALSDDDRQSIKQSLLEEVVADTNPSLTFAARDLTTVVGPGTATIDATVAGVTSTLAMAFTTTITDDRVVVDATGVLDGKAHGMPRNFLGECINPDMDLHLHLELVPGVSQEQPAPPDADADGAWVQQTFPDDGCGAAVGFNDARDVLERRCAGCHMTPQRGGATVPLVEYGDWRVDSARHPGVPLSQTAAELLQLDPDAALHMPPGNDTQLTADELSTALAWLDDGGHERRCQDDPAPSVFTPVAPQAQGAPSFDDVAPFLEASCMGCHREAGAESGIPQFPDWASGTAPVQHPFYQPLTIWEASLARLDDGSMPPGGAAGAGIDDVTLQTFREFIAIGYPEH